MTKLGEQKRSVLSFRSLEGISSGQHYRLKQGFPVLRPSGLVHP